MKGNQGVTKVHLQGKDEDFIVFVESRAAVDQWKKDTSVPLAQVVDGFKIFVTHKQGNQGVMDAASKAALEDEFGTHKDDDVIKQILERGTVIESESKGRDGVKNVTKGDFVSHN